MKTSCAPEPKPMQANKANYLPKRMAPIRAGCWITAQRVWEGDAPEVRVGAQEGEMLSRSCAQARSPFK